MRRMIATLATAGAVAAGGIAATAAFPAFAQTPESSPSASPSDEAAARRAHRGAHLCRGHGPLHDLVDDGTITEDQATAVREALREARASADADDEPGEVLDQALASLVEAGTVTQAQADAIDEAIREKFEQRAAFRRGFRRGLRRGMGSGDGTGAFDRGGSFGGFDGPTAA